ncbi:MAG: DEAD/DEAH box helicase [Propionibacteriaceae bacterium]
MSVSFVDLGVPARLTRVLAERGIDTPTPIQEATLRDSNAGRDVLGRGRTGSGKTYAFLLPLVARLHASPSRTQPGKPRALILAPTRELVGQIETALEPLAAAAGLTSITVFGGVGQNPQVRGLRGGVDIVVACPGRLEDLIKQRAADLSNVEITVLDEADHMADLGFLPAVTRLLGQTAPRGQRMLFSATLDGAINGLVRKFLKNPATHEADSAQSPVSAMTHHILHVERDHRISVVTDLASAPGRTIVFTRTKHGAKALARQLNSRGVPSVELHGNLAQNARTRNMDAFHSGAASTLVATDIAARGIHVDDVALVVHADPPIEAKAYLHRSGRTARAGNEGTVVTLMTDDQVRDVRALTRAAGIKATTTKVPRADHPVLAQIAPGERVLVEGGWVAPASAAGTGGGNGGGNGGGRGRGTGGGRSTGGGGRGTGGGRGRSGSRGPSSTSAQPTGAGNGRPGGPRSGGSRTGGGRSAGRRSGGGSGGGLTYSTSTPSGSGNASNHSAASFSGRSRAR